MKTLSATIDDVETALNAFKLAAQGDASLEHESRKKLAAAVDALTPKDDVTKLLNQSYNYGENWWAKNVLDNEKEGCKKENKLEKIKQHVLKSDAYHRLNGNEDTKGKVERWIEKKFQVQPEQMDEAA